MKIKIILSITLLIICICFNGLHAEEKQGQVEITAIVNDKAVSAMVKINKSKDRDFAYWTMYQPGGPILPTPLTIPLSAGKYYLHIKPLGLHSAVKEKVIPFSLTAGDKLTYRVVFPVGHLKVTSHDEDTGKEVNTSITIKQGWRQLAPPMGSTLHTTADIIISPGKYQLTAIQTEDRRTIVKTVTVAKDKISDINIKFKKSHVSYLTVNIEMDGRILPLQQYSKYGELLILDPKTNTKINQISGGYGKEFKLPSGQYTVKFDSKIMGKEDVFIEDINLSDNQHITQNIHLKQPGELIIHGIWSDKPKNLLKCLKSKNPFTNQRIGTLLGGPGGSSGGKCFDKRIFALITELSPVNSSESYISRNTKSYTSPELYNIKIWPYDHKNLAKLVKNIAIKPGINKEITLDFPWPYVDKKINNGNKMITVRERKKPIGEGVINISATINGVPTNVKAMLNLSKLDYKGDKSNGTYNFFTRENGKENTGLKLPIQKRVPSGFYNTTVEPFGPHLVLMRRSDEFYVKAGKKINRTVDFKTGRLIVKSTKNNFHPDDLISIKTIKTKVSVLHRYHRTKLPMDIQITPGNYQLKLYTSKSSLYFTKNFTITEGKTSSIIVD